MTPEEAIPILTEIRRLYAGSRYPTFDDKVAALDCAIRELTHIVTFEEATMSDCGPERCRPEPGEDRYGPGPSPGRTNE